jgi:peptide/nickel transport system substrate-binding protein
MTRTSNYWDKVLNRRLSRRRSLGALAGGAAAAAFLAACGGDDDDGGTSGSGSTPSAGTTPGAAPTQESGLLATREDTTGQAVKGGTLISTNPADPPHFDPHLLTLPAAAATSLLFNKLLKVKPGVLQTADGTIEPDFASDWELSGDSLTLTLKIRQDAGTPEGPPLNGRKLDAEDVVFSWNRWAATGSARQDLVNAVNPAAPILSLEATDSQTVVIKLREPTASILAAISPNLQGQFFIVPREADGGFDVGKDPHGGGAYFLEEYKPSAGLTYARNPNGYDQFTYPDKIQTPIITENAQVVAQMIAGNILTHYRAFPPEDVLDIKRQEDRISLYDSPFADVGVTTFYGFKAGPLERAPFRDERVRQAWSRAMDRDLYITTFANVDRFADEGLEAQMAWNSAMRPSDYAGWYLDPQGSDFGENAAFYQFDLAESKALLSAAGYPDGLDIVSQEAAGTNYGLSYPVQVEAIHGMAQAAGFRIDRKQHVAPAPWNAEFRDSRGFFEGIAFRLTPVPPEPRDGLFAVYNKNGSLNYGFDPDGAGVESLDGPFVGDSFVDDLTAKIRQEFDRAAAVDMAHELQRYLGKKQYFSRALGSATSFDVAWPAVRNFAVFEGLAWGFLWKEYWIDKTQAPLA